MVLILILTILTRKSFKDMSSSYDPLVIIRAYRFIAKLAGHRIVRGDHMDRPTNRADRYYLVPLEGGHDDEVRVKEESSGYRTIKDAAKAARRGQST